MHISPFFHNLRSAYQAELDDLRSDSEGHDVLKKRLAEKRRELGFLVQMMELSPEMVAVVLHQALRFSSPAAMDHLVAQEADDLPDWDSIRDTVDIAPWAQETVQTILKEPMGEWFMTIASALEYMQNRPLTSAERAQLEALEDEDGTEDRDARREERHDDNHTEDHDEEEADAQAREDAGNDWLVEQGFDRKE
jgi:hypothetical protein